LEESGFEWKEAGFEWKESGFAGKVGIVQKIAGVRIYYGTSGLRTKSLYINQAFGGG
jgi:hypothetical protein